MDKTEIIERVKKYAQEVLKYFQVNKIILFGSYAYGQPHEYSDIDVAVVVNKISDDILATEAFLFSLVDKVDIRIEPILLEAGNDKSGFLDYIMGKGIIIYQAL